MSGDGWEGWLITHGCGPRPLPRPSARWGDALEPQEPELEEAPDPVEQAEDESEEES